VDTRSTPIDALGSVALTLALGALWWGASHSGWVSRVFLPTPEATFSSLREGLKGGELVQFTVATTGRMVEGWLLASLLGVALGALIGVSRRARLPAADAGVRAPVAGIGTAAAGHLDLRPEPEHGALGGRLRRDVASAARHAAGNATLPPAAAASPQSRGSPDILAGMRLSLTVALIVAVVGEMIASQPGLGQAILLAARAFRASELFAGIVLLGLIGLASNALLALAERRLLKWQTP
jgi:sulfonate transport system permease protein